MMSELIKNLRRIAEIGEGWGPEEDIQAVCREAADALAAAPEKGAIITRECEQCKGHLLVHPRVYDGESAADESKRSNDANAK